MFESINFKKKIDNQIWLTWLMVWLPLPLHNKIEKVKKEKRKKSLDRMHPKVCC
jgi:hypothetical protein